MGIKPGTKLNLTPEERARRKARWAEIGKTAAIGSARPDVTARNKSRGSVSLGKSIPEKTRSIPEKTRSIPEKTRSIPEKTRSIIEKDLADQIASEIHVEFTSPSGLTLGQLKDDLAQLEEDAVRAEIDEEWLTIPLAKLESGQVRRLREAGFVWSPASRMWIRN